MRVIELWRYPVKSMQGERLTAADVTATGIVGDRSWGVYDRETSTILTARRSPRLLFAAARFVDGQVVVTTSKGERLATDRDLSAWLDRDVELRRAGTRAGGRFEAPADNFDETGVWKAWEGPPGSFHDSTRTRLSLGSTASLGEWDARRFRLNVLLDGEGEEHWFGTTLAAGSALLEVRKRIDRCVVVTRAQPGGIERDLEVLRTINATSGGCLGIGTLVVRPGRLAVDDEVRPA